VPIGQRLQALSCLHLAELSSSATRTLHVTNSGRAAAPLARSGEVLVASQSRMT
jgi:hypothetical protein